MAYAGEDFSKHFPNVYLGKGKNPYPGMTTTLQRAALAQGEGNYQTQI